MYSASNVIRLKASNLSLRQNYLLTYSVVYRAAFCSLKLLECKKSSE